MMFKSAARQRIGLNHGQPEAWLMGFVRRLTDRLARPDLLRSGELSPYLQRDIGLDDGRTGGFRCRP
jgi:hypothetical protein